MSVGDALTVAEIAQHPQTLARGLIYQQRDRAGHDWFMLGPPMRLSATKLRQPPPAEALLDWPAVAAQLTDAAE
jgi:crotonobetainyl-CoA:carnitine CoA-transferase CaiB-like acyl-CoA transferase